jgi:hypothetical protein
VCLWFRTSEDWHDEPEELLTKEQFIETINVEKWELAFNVLINYISRHNKDVV